MVDSLDVDRLIFRFSGLETGGGGGGGACIGLSTVFGLEEVRVKKRLFHQIPLDPRQRRSHTRAHFVIIWSYLANNSLPSRMSSRFSPGTVSTFKSSAPVSMIVMYALSSCSA